MASLISGFSQLPIKFDALGSSIHQHDLESLDLNYNLKDAQTQQIWSKQTTRICGSVFEQIVGICGCPNCSVRACEQQTRAHAR